MRKTILVVGSSNTDMVINADHLPMPGETVLGGKFFMNPGGKGANQAVAAARMGGRVCFITKTGNDVFGDQAKNHFGDEGIDTRHMISDPDHPSGVALITVDKLGENCIVVASGANAALTPGDLEEAREVIASADVILLQLEIPIETVEYVADAGRRSGAVVILNPAPAQKLSKELLRNISIITPNIKEADMLTGVSIRELKDAEKACAILFGHGPQHVIITMGSKGVLVYDGKLFTHIPAKKVEAVDTTAAGDVFNGALAAALAEGIDILQSVDLANMAASISVTRHGAQSSAPKRGELQ